MNDAEATTVKLAELLRHPDDLNKIPALRSEFTRKKADVDSQLKLGLKGQLEITQNGMTSLADGQRTVNLIKDEMIKIDRLCAEAANMIRDFPHINRVAQTHRNFAQVEAMQRDIEAFEERLAGLEMRLREDDADMENQPNLLHVHMELSRLRDFRDEAMEQIKNSGDASLELIDNLRLPAGATLQEYFARLDEAVDWFDEHVGTACMNLIPLVQSGNNGMVVRLALVIEEEEKKDRKVMALQEAQKEYKELASRFKSIAAAPKELRGYKSKFLKAIEMSAANQMEESNEAFLEDADKLERSVRWYFNDLNTVKLGMTQLMPKKWRIFETYVNIYHKQMHDWLVARIDDPELKPTHMLAILNWVEKYHAKMQKLGVPAASLQPALLDGREAELVREYRQLIVKAVEEWMDRMSATDRRAFHARAEDAFDTDEHGCFRTKTLADMWRMLREQLLVAEASQRPDVVDGVVEAMIRALAARQRMWEALVDAELNRYSQPAADLDGSQPFLDWLVAVANDQIACIDDGDESAGPADAQLSFLTRFSRDVAPLVSPGHAAAVAAQVDGLREGYIDLGTHCLSVFAAMIFATDFRGLFADFFTPAWYAGKGVAQAVATFRDYLADYAPVLHPSLRDILLEELSEALLARYLACARNKGVRVQRPADAFVERVKEDVVTVFNFFGESAAAFDVVKQKWRAVDGFVRLVDADKKDVPDAYERFKRDYWDAGMGWVEAVLRARDDFDRGLLNAVKARAASMEVTRGPETVMGKVK